MQTTPTQDRTLGVAIIGSGLMAKAHTMAWRNVGAVYGSIPVTPRLVVLCDATEDLARDGAMQFGYEKYTTSWEDAVNDPDVDVVDIVTPNWLHQPIAIAAAKAGKHIWCEKPLALTATGAHDMVEAAEQAGVKTLVGFSFVRNPAVTLAKQLIEAGEIGDPVSFVGAHSIAAMVDPETPFTWRQERKLAGAGAIGDLGAHVISIARYLVGDIDMLASTSSIVHPERPLTDGAFGYGEKADGTAPKRSVENDDISLTLMRFANGAIGTIEASRVAIPRGWDLSFTLTGTKGAVRFDQQHIYKLDVALASDGLQQRGFRTLEIGPGHGDFGNLWPIHGANIGNHDLKFFEVHDLIRAIVDDHPVWPDFREGYEVERVIDAIEEGSATGQWVALR
ncbi:Gfo/Idh/MocA family protein [Mycolicibacterium komossense]|uniref:Gfo/Idh/MocA family oxidoreductase n=1 Tax=Mycolicibacterium komossense TaxID=1779 RepID=A0ABT3C5L0_9MYCO|nr:Gfo/Idh/MocA family oxidoreductase [Mycolicibacterium komossense]MCV7224753.1 Gfo/Idh/MocA family oxidoreductase [Mycolicibacterium komossense]